MSARTVTRGREDNGEAVDTVIWANGFRPAAPTLLPICLQRETAPPLALTRPANSSLCSPELDGIVICGSGDLVVHAGRGRGRSGGPTGSAG